MVGTDIVDKLCSLRHWESIEFAFPRPRHTISLKVPPDRGSIAAALAEALGGDEQIRTSSICAKRHGQDHIVIDIIWSE